MTRSGRPPSASDSSAAKYKGLIGVATTSDEKLRYVEKSIQCYERGWTSTPTPITAPPICLPSIASATETETRSVSRPYCKTRLPLASEQKVRLDRRMASPDAAAAVFDAGDADRAEELSDEIAAEGLARWKIDLLLDYLDASIERIKDSHLRLRLCAVIRRFRSVLPPTASDRVRGSILFPPSGIDAPSSRAGTRGILRDGLDPTSDERANDREERRKSSRPGVLVPLDNNARVRRDLSCSTIIAPRLTRADRSKAQRKRPPGAIRRP